MMKNFAIGIMLVGLIGLWECDAQATYRAAVYEHQPAKFDPYLTPFQNMLQNLVVYGEQAKIAASQGVEIIVFPEYGIANWTFVPTREIARNYFQSIPNPEIVEWNPCLNPDEYPNTEVVQYLSCMARNNSIVIVANLGDIQDCDSSTDPKCPSDGSYLLNTNIALGADGLLLARYHKQNLMDETPPYDYPPTVEYVSFTATKEHVTFGMFICFDLLFEEPVIPLITERGITNFVYSSQWGDELPFVTSVQMQESFARGNNVNFIAANLYVPVGGTLGCGIYSGTSGALNYTFDPPSGPKLIIADVPVQPGSSLSTPTSQVKTNIQKPNNFVKADDEPYHYIKNISLGNYTNVQLTGSSGSAQACYEDICCNIEYEFDDSESSDMPYTYFLTAYSGNRNLDLMYNWNWQLCALVMCTDATNPDSCGPSDFAGTLPAVKSLNLSGNFSTQFIYPVLFTPELELVDGGTWSFSNSYFENGKDVGNGIYDAEITSIDTNQEVRLLVAQLMARRYDLDENIHP